MSAFREPLKKKRRKKNEIEIKIAIWQRLGCLIADAGETLV
jgi:hypothetical protein